ncbi:MAG: hypothetical protein RMY29_007190 [Nostoc sp. CreGUA01]|nr:hypothetical protein [Nostoc sp. CreGUA01]
MGIWEWGVGTEKLLFSPAPSPSSPSSPSSPLPTPHSQKYFQFAAVINTISG